MEDGVIAGGLGSAVLEYLADNHFSDIQVERIGLPDSFVTHGSMADLTKLCEIDADGIYKKLNLVLHHPHAVGQESNSVATTKATVVVPIAGSQF